MKEVIVQQGTHIEYETTAKSIVFGDEDLSINLKNREADEKVMIDICYDQNGQLTMGCAEGYRYVAQVEIPAREYTEEPAEQPDHSEDGMGGEGTVKVPVAFDIEKCTVYLWAI